ncbi:hypothetical protein AGMMS49942_27510 [Spirochaetia bacterium]|nr:hypothetical protein AGMMS49942_27510 [Spirochaetia bacterium]
MTIEQTVVVPANRRVFFDLPLSVPEGEVEAALVLFPKKEAAAKGEGPSVVPPVAYPPELDEAARKVLAEEPLPQVTRAELEEWAKDPVIQFLDQGVELDWSWLPEGKMPETVTKADFRALAKREKYGI